MYALLDYWHLLGWRWNGYDIYGDTRLIVLWATDGKEFIIVVTDLGFDEARLELIRQLTEIVKL